MNAFTIVSRPYYSDECQQYVNVLCIEGVPVGPIVKRTRRLMPDRRLPNRSNDSCHCKCWTAISDDNCSKFGYLTGNDVTSLMQWFLKCGYHVDTKLTKMQMMCGVQQPLSKIVYTVTYPPAIPEENIMKRPNVA